MVRIFPESILEIFPSDVKLNCDNNACESSNNINNNNN
jgi:hypothetical protein